MGIEIIASSHGAIHNTKDKINYVLNLLWEEWSSLNKDNEKVLVIYLTMYSASQEMAEIVFDELKSNCIGVIVRDALNNIFDVIIQDAVNVRGILFIGPSFIDATLHPLLHHIVYSLSALKPKAKPFWWDYLLWLGNSC